MRCCRASPARARSSSTEEAPSRRRARLRPGEPGAHRARAHADDGDHQRALRAQHPHRPVQPHPQEPRGRRSAASRCRSTAPSCARSSCRPTSTSSRVQAAARLGPDRLRPDAGVRGDRRAVRRHRQVPHAHRGPRLLAHRAARDPAPGRSDHRRVHARPGPASIRSSWSTSARRCSRSSPTSPRPARSSSPPRFTLEIGDTTGTMHFCIPYATLEPIRDVLYSHDAGRRDRARPALGQPAEAPDPVRRGRAGGRAGARAGHRRAAAGVQARRLHRARPRAR